MGLMLGRPSPLRGRSFPDKQEEKSLNWKGEDVGYRALHAWVEKKMGKAKRCEECGLTQIPSTKKRYFQWANISREYKRDLVDWKQLCIKCHKAYDRH